MRWCIATSLIVSVNWRCPSVYKQISVCSHSGIFLSSGKEQTTDICNNVNESQKHYAEQKKPGMYSICRNLLVQPLRHVWLYATPWTAALQASLSFTISWSLLKLTSIGVSDAIQPSHPLSSPSPPAFNLSQHHSFLMSCSLHQVAKVLQLQHQSFQWIFRTDFLYDWLVWSPCCPWDSQESSPAPQFKSINSSALSLLYSPTLTSIHDYWKNHSFD